MANKNKDPDFIAIFHDRDLYIPTRTIHLRHSSEDLGEDINAIISSRFLKNLHILESLSQDPITIIMSTCGGEIYEGMAIYDAIRQSLCIITIIVRGECMSMGSYILQAADHRVMSEHSLLMMHRSTTGLAAQDHEKSSERWSIFNRKYAAKMHKILKNRIVEKKPEFRGKKFEEMLDFDTILTAEEAVEWGLASKVLYNPKD